MFVTPFNNVITEAGKYAAAIYIEDEKSHTNFHSPANRFYEMLSAGIPLFFDHLCTRMLSRAEIIVPNEWCVGNGTDLANKLKTTDLVEMRDEQQALWSKDYAYDLKQRLLEISYELK